MASMTPPFIVKALMNSLKVWYRFVLHILVLTEITLERISCILRMISSVICKSCFRSLTIYFMLFISKKANPLLLTSSSILNTHCDTSKL